MLHLFSASAPLLQYGREHCRVHSSEMSTLILDLFTGYRVEGLTVPYTMEEFIQQAEKRLILGAPVEMRLEGLTPEQRLQGIPPQQRLEGIPPQQRLEGIPPQQLLEKLLSAQGLTPEQREELRRLLDEPPPA